jgi:hypothetical protein
MTTQTRVYKMSRPVSVYDWYRIFSGLGGDTGNCDLYKYRPSHYGFLSMSWYNMVITIHTNKQDKLRILPESTLKHNVMHVAVLPFDVAEADRVFRGEPASDANDVFLTVTNVEGEEIHSQITNACLQYLAKDELFDPIYDDLLPEFSAEQVSYDYNLLTASDVYKVKALPIQRILSWFVDHLKVYYDKMRIRQREYDMLSFSLDNGIHIKYRVMVYQHDDIAGRFENIEMRKLLQSHLNKFDDVLRTKLQ